MKTKDVARAVVLVAIAAALGSVSIPVGITKCAPFQHMVNVIGAVMLGPVYALGIAFFAGVIRNMLGTGTLFAFPGGMIGALLAGLAYRMYKNVYSAGLGEVVGTGLLGTLASVYIVAPIFMGKSMALGMIIAAFSASTLGGTIIGIIALKILQKAKIWEP